MSATTLLPSNAIGRVARVSSLFTATIRLHCSFSIIVTVSTLAVLHFLPYILLNVDRIFRAAIDFQDSKFELLVPGLYFAQQGFRAQLVSVWNPFLDFSTRLPWARRNKLLSKGSGERGRPIGLQDSSQRT